LRGWLGRWGRGESIDRARSCWSNAGQTLVETAADRPFGRAGRQAPPARAGPGLCGWVGGWVGGWGVYCQVTLDTRWSKPGRAFPQVLALGRGAGRGFSKRWPNGGKKNADQTLVKRWSNAGQTRSGTGRTSRPGLRARALSTASSAILRYVVHFPAPRSRRRPYQ
jgi:hypothetical protein